MRTRMFLLAASLSAPGLVQANDLMQIYDLAVQNDMTLQAAIYQRDAAIEAYPQARAALLPQISGGFDYTNVDSEQTVKSSTPGFGGTTTTKGTNQSLSVGLSQSILNLESIRLLQQASRQAALAETTLRSAEQNLMLRVSQAYFALLGARDNLRSAQAEQAALERQLEQARKRFDVGLSAITDVQEAQARYDLTVATVIQAQQTLSAAEEALIEITGKPLLSANGLVDEIPLPGPDPSKVEEWVEEAKKDNLDLLAAELGFEAAQIGVQVARSRHLPTVDLTAGYSDSTSETGAFPTDYNSTSVGVSVTLPIFTSGLIHSQVKQAIATREQRQAQFAGTQRLVERTTRDAYQAVVTGISRVKAFKQAVVSSTTALDASETGLEVGARTAVDVLNAEQQLYAAQRNFYQSRYDYLQSVLRLKAASGRLAVKDLQEIDQLLVLSLPTAEAEAAPPAEDAAAQ